MHTIRPREYAGRIAKLPTLEERREALKLVPKEYLAMVTNTYSLNFYDEKDKTLNGSS